MFAAVNCLISVDRDDDVAFELHSKVGQRQFLSIGFFISLMSISYLVS